MFVFLLAENRQLFVSAGQTACAQTCVFQYYLLGMGALWNWSV